MSRDILFKMDDWVFSLRVGGVLRHGDTVLLQCPRGTEEYAVIGGHVQALETAAETLVREYREELHAEVAVGGLLCVGENFFPWGDKTCHQICFYYDVRLEGKPAIPLEGTFQGWDELGGQRTDLDFRWVPVERLKEGFPIYPPEIIPYLTQSELKNGHFVYKET